MKKKYNQIILMTYIVLYMLGVVAFIKGAPRIGLSFALGGSIISNLNHFLEEKRNWIIIGRDAVISILIVILIIVRYTP
ncbi:hypothetical protein [Fusibacter ferrireducens]|uniref:Uncharacterized protein n=1 Tax=Fusibacter ferrireducens TaxID=2785058 RepID=A0ABR9ZNF2_9FIRM|nr:hypothetical protein [Fusibacter ferrireducens]MBF4692003.1 hypothetical protein [Fusibacter ferrireducens]